MDNRINLNLFRFFITAAESRSFSEAGEKLGYSDPTVSINIKTLEKQLGVKLFTRDPLKLTTIGEEIYETVKNGFSDLDFALILAKSRENLEYGKMSIGCPSHITQFFLMERIAQAVNDYPNLQIELDTESKIKELIQLLKDNKIDFAILDSIPNEVKKDVEIKEIKETEYIFVSKKEIKIKNAKELEAYNYILPYENKTSNIKLIEILKNNEISLNTVLRCPTTEPRIEAAKLNIGIAYVMKDTVKEAYIFIEKSKSEHLLF